MRRTTRVLSAAVLSGAALGVFAGSGSADPGGTPRPAGAGGPAAEVSPADAGPGDTVTVSVTCDPAGGAAPDTLDAVSPAFDGGTVALLKVAGADGGTSRTAYRGTARIAPAGELEADPDAAGPASPWTVDGTCPASSGGGGRPWSAAMTVSSPASGGAEPGRSPGNAAPEPSCRPSTGPRDEPAVPREAPVVPREEPVVPDGEPTARDETAPYAEPAAPGDEAVPDEAAPGDGSALDGETVPGDGSVPGGETVPNDEAVPDDQSALSGRAAPDDQSALSGRVTSYDRSALPGRAAPAGHSATHGVPCTTRPPCPGPTAWDASCGGGKAEHGVQAGTGGSLTDSVPALAAGGVLIAGAFGGAAYRLRLRLRRGTRAH
ncbi:hypothetical protein [Streptomyces sp. JHA26]|uniref:hypothetical protein n=1 Tax=Streptomyces sp. JHA26 TaxID=1917143 RepID=UPI000989CCFD|nr:hypothetical protein [Streptomyces sp. JHA26]